MIVTIDTESIVVVVADIYQSTVCSSGSVANSDASYSTTVASGGSLTLPDSNLNDSAGTLISTNPSVKTVVAPDATAVLKNSAGTTISTELIPSNQSEDITAPDATAVLKNTDGTTISTELIPSNVSEDITAPDATAVLKNTLNTTLLTELIPSNVSEDITAPDAKIDIGTTVILGPSDATTSIAFSDFKLAPDAVTSATLRLWYKSDTGVTTSGSLVDQWNDQSGNGNNLISSGAARPTFTASYAGANGMPTIDFDGTNTEMSHSVSWDFQYIIVVVSQEAALPFGNFYGLLTGRTGDFL